MADRKQQDELRGLRERFATLEAAVAGISFFVPGALIGIVPAIIKAGSFVQGRGDKIEKERTERCKTTTAVNIRYEVEGTTTETDPATGKVLKTCTTYKITTSVIVTETCFGEGTREVGKSSHVSRRKFCNDESDEPATGESVGFDGKQTDTLTYPHGAKVTVEKTGDKIKITVVYPDGTTASLDVPA
jgi:hypothetical protein